MVRVPQPDDPIGFDDHLINMSAYWRYLRIVWMSGLRKKFTIGALLLLFLDYLRLRLISFYI